MFLPILTIPAFADVPPAPTNLIAILEDKQVTLEWDMPYDVDAPVHAYFIENKLSYDSQWGSIDIINNNTSYVASGLANGVSYEFRVSGINTYGISDSTTVTAIPESIIEIQELLDMVTNNTNTLNINKNTIDANYATLTDYNYTLMDYNITLITQNETILSLQEELAALTLLVNSLLEPQSEAPKIIAVTASDPDNLDDVYSDGVIITINFDEDTNQPGGEGTQQKSAVDDMFAFSDSIGQGHNGVWATPDTFVITITNINGAGPPLIGITTVTPTGITLILSADETTTPSTVTSPVLGGDWGVTPDTIRDKHQKIKDKHDKNKQ